MAGVIRIPIRRMDRSIKAYALVDAGDAYLAEIRWSQTQTGYVVKSFKEGPRYLHRAVLGLERGDKREVDHINRDKLDNRRSNLRIVTRAQNGQNLPAHPNSTSRHRGVYWNSGKGKWDAVVKINYKQHLVYRGNDEEAAAAAAREFRIQMMTHAVEKAA